MRLSRLRVRNIRSYESGAIDFAPGTTLIVGDVGAGKTSLLYAIEMALFGVAEVDAAYLVRHGAPHSEVTVGFEDDEHRYEISRRFRRVRRRGRETFEPEKITFRQDGATTTYSATELRQRIIDLLGFPDNPTPQAHSDLWRWAVYVPQERMRDILSAKPQDRLETVRKALGVERYRTAADNAQELATDLRRSSTQRRAEAERLRHFEEEFAQASLEEDRLRAEAVALKDRIAGLESSVAAQRERVHEVESSLLRGEADRRELESLSREQETDRRAVDERTRLRGARAQELEKRQVELAAFRQDLPDTGVLERALEEAEVEQRRSRDLAERHAIALRELAEARAELAAAGRRSGEAATRRAQAIEDRDEARRRLDSADAEGPTKEPPAPTPEAVPELEAKLEEARRSEGVALEALTQAKTARDELTSLLEAGVCPRCHQKVDPGVFATHRAEAEEAVLVASRTLNEARGAREGAEARRAARERFERAHDRWLDAERRRATARQDLERTERSLADAERGAVEAAEHFASSRGRVEKLAPRESEEEMLRRALAAAESEYARRRADLEAGRLAAEKLRAGEQAVAALLSELERIDRDLLDVDRRSRERAARIDGLLRSTEELKVLRDRSLEVRAELERGEAALADQRLLLARTETRFDNEVLRRAAAEKGRAERASLLAEATDLDGKAEWVGGSFRRAVLEMEQKLLEHAQLSFEREFARYFASLIDDPSLVARTDLAFTPAVTIDGEWTPAEALSGGERTSLALAFRLALAKIVRSLGSLRLDTILLDEPTDGFSPEQVVRMGELLDELALPQVVVVSHEGQLAAVADRTVRVEKRDGKSELVRDPERPGRETVAEETPN